MVVAVAVHLPGKLASSRTVCIDRFRRAGRALADSSRTEQPAYSRGTSRKRSALRYCHTHASVETRGSLPSASCCSCGCWKSTRRHPIPLQLVGSCRRGKRHPAQGAFSPQGAAAASSASRTRGWKSARRRLRSRLGSSSRTSTPNVWRRQPLAAVVAAAVVAAAAGHRAYLKAAHPSSPCSSSRAV